jgi:hypothetical protein
MPGPVTITIRFSRCAPPTWREMWINKSLKDYSICICRMTHSQFSHVDLLWDKGGVYGLLGASDNFEAPHIIGNPRGVAIRPVNYQRFAIRRDAVIHTTPAIKEAFENFCYDQLNKPFDTEALKFKTFLSPSFHRDWRDLAKWFCAELMGRATEVSKLIGYEYPGVKNRMTAADLLVFLAPVIDFVRFELPVSGLVLGPGEI